MYKRLLPIVLSLLLLTACASQTNKNSASPPEGEQQPTDVAAVNGGASASAPEGTAAGTEDQKIVRPETAPPEPEPEPDPRQEAVGSALSSMSLEEKVGQMFFVRCPDVGAAEDVSAYHLGGYILFGRDFKDASDNWLTKDQFIANVAAYQAEAKIPLLIGVDEEGGTVARASRDPNLFAAKFQSPQDVFASGGLEAVRTDAADKSTGLLELGINVNLAPVADVSVDPADFIYDRSFGQDAGATADFVETVVSAANQVQLEQEDGSWRFIGSVLKHFPGYGNNVDTHTGVAIDERPYETFQSQDFLPFQAGIEAGAGGVLVNHNVVTCMDPDLPASLSPEVHRVLREELGFEGVIMTDDLDMDAVKAYAEDGSVAVLAALAGNDLIVTTDYQEQIPLVIDAVRTGLLSEDLIDQAVTRVLGWKYDLGLLTFS